MKKPSHNLTYDRTDTNLEHERHWLERIKKIKIRNEALLKIIKYFTPNDHNKPNQ